MSNEYINDEVCIILNSIAEKHQFKQFNLEVGKDSLQTDGCTGIMKTVKIFNANDSNQVLSLLIKSSPQEKNRRKIFPVVEFFNTEIYMYDIIFPCFQDLEIQNGVTHRSIIEPKFFGSLLNDQNEVIILENLNENGYRLHDKNTPMNSEHICLVIAALAKFHSFSFALRDRQPKMFENLQTKLCTSFPKLIDNFKDLLIQKYINILNILDEDDCKRLRSFLENADHEFQDLSNPPIDEHSVILHGDCWTNNILFKYLDLKSSSPVEISLIDYQLSRLAPPVLDLAQFLFICGSEEEIKQCDKYLNFYYKTFSTHLQKLGCDPNKLYPFSAFMKQWKKYAKFSLIIAPIVLLIILGTENATRGIQQSAKTGLTLLETFKNIQNNEEYYNKTLKTIVSFLAKNNLI